MKKIEELRKKLHDLEATELRMRKEWKDTYNLIKELEKEEHSIVKVEWGGSLRCMTSDGRNVNIAEELNTIEKEKNEHS